MCFKDVNSDRTTGRGVQMKSAYMILIFMIIFPISILNDCYAAKNKEGTSEQAETAINSFKKHVEIFNRFFSSSPLILHDQTYPKSPSGRIYFFTKYTLSNIEYDIHKTDSIITPLFGIIKVTLGVADNTSCGDIRE